MHGAGAALLWACLFVTSIAAHNVTRRDAKGGSKRVVCYYTNWSVYRPGTAKFNPQNINPYLCTHLIYAFGGLTRENGLRPYDKYQDIEQGGYAKFTGLKTYNKQLKTMLAIGGWNEGSTRFSPLVASSERRVEFVKNVVRFLRQNHFDGLDLDWEYPAFRDGGKPRDRDNYALLVQELREEFDRESSKTGRPRLLLTMAVPAGIEYIDKGYDIPKLNRYLDFMNILSYDYHSSFEPSVNHHSPLYPLEEEGEYNFDAQLSIDYTINHYLKLGADRDKLVLGIPTYGRSYTLFNPDSTEIGAPADGPGEQGDATREKGYLAYYEICENLQSTDEWKVEKPNPRAMGPYAYRGNQWVGYDDEDIVKRKARYVTEMGLGGIMYWAIDNDDFRGKCHGRPYPLIEAGKEAMLAGAGTANELDSPSKSKTRPKPRVTTEEPPIVNSGGGSSRPSSSGGKRRRPSIKTKTHEKHASTTTSTTPSYKYPTSTPEPPTTPDPGSDFKCEDEGFFPHPRDCKKYFWCLDSGPSNLGIVAHQFTCPSGLYFNKAADSCDYTRNVVCNIKPKAEAVTTTTTKRPDTTTSRNVRITTTTTTEAPEEEEEEYEDDEEEIQPEEDPRAIKELIDLIKKLGGIENLEKQLHFDESKEKEVANSATPPAISKKLYDRVLSQANVRGNSNANFYSPPSSRSSTPHTLIYKSRGRQNEGLENLPEVAVARQEKPQYVTIRRERPTTPTPIEDPEEEEVIDDEESETVNDTKNEKTVKPSGREYVNIRRDRPSKPAEEEVTTSKYASIRRQKPSPVTEVVEDTNDVVAIVEEVTTTTPEPVTTPVTQETPVFRKKLTAFTPRTPKTGSVLENFRRKKKEEVVEVTTVEGKEDIVTVTTETTTLKVSEASQKNGSSTLPYLEVTRGRGSRLSTTQSTLEDDLSSVNINDASTSAPQVEANNITTLNPSLTSESTTTEELISPPIETVPPTTTSEPTPLSTTTRFTPTVTRVVISESESGTTERQRISLSKYKGFYLTVSPLSPRTTVAPDNNSTRQVEKIKEVNRITEVTFRDDFSIPFTRPISLNETTTKSNQNQNNTSVSIDDDTLYSTTDPSETDSTIPDNQDNNEISFPGITKEVDTTTQQVTNASSSLSTEGRGRFRQPFRGTSTRSPLPRSQRRRTTVASTLLGEVTDSSDQVSTRRPFVPKRRGSYRPNSQTGSGEELKGSTLSQEEGVQIFSRRTTTTSTVRPDRFVPEYRSRGRTKIVESNPEEEQEVDVYEQDEPEQEVQITPVINRNRPIVLPRSRSKISNLSQQEAIDQGQTLNPEVNRVRPSLVLPRTRVRIASPAQQEIPEQDEETNSEIEDNNSSPDPPRSRGKIVNPVEQEAPEEEEQTNSEINSDIPSQTPPRGRIVNPVQEEVYEEEDQTTPEINRDIPSRIPPRYRGRIAHPVTQEAPEEEEQINPEINRDISSRIPPRSRGRIIYPVQQEAPEEEEQINPEINIDIPSRIPARSRGRPLYVPSTPVESDIRQTSSRRPTSRFRNPTTTAKPERIYSPQQRNRERKKLVTSTEGNVDELVSQQTLSPQSVTLQEETATPATPRDTTIRSRTGQRVVKKIKKRLLNGTTTTSDPTTSHTTAPLSSSTLEELQYESKKLGADAVTPIPPTETYQDPSTLDILDGVTQSNTVYEDELTATPTPNEDYGTTVDIDGQQFVTYAIVPQDEVLETQFSSSSVDVSDRGAHKFSLGDVLLAADDDSVEPKLLKILPPRTFKSRVTTRTRQRVPQDTTNESNEDFKNSLGTSSETGQDISRVPGYKRKTVIKRKRLPDQLASTSESDDVEAGAQGEVPSTTARTFLRRRPENSSFYSNSRLRSRPTTSTTTTAAPLPNVRPSRRQQTPTSRLAVSRRRKYGSDANSTATAAGSASTVSEVAATEPIVTTLVTGEPEIITAEPGRKFSFPRRRTKPTPITQTINDDNNNTENIDGKNNDSNNNNKTKSITLTVKAALHHVIDSQNEPSTVAGAQANLDDAPSAVAEETSTALPDLANGAVVAIHNLVTIPTRPSPRRKTYFESSSTPYIVSTATTPRRKTYFESSSTPYIVATATTPTPPPRISTSATPYFPRRGSAVYVTPTSTAAPVQRGRPFSKITSGQIYPQSGSVEDFEYYDSGESIFSSNPVTGKVKIHSDGYIECLDQGNFPHPFSCKKFISCAKMENSDVLGWEYTCPRHLSFDPIGGICNWSAGLGCKE